jgi:N-acetylglucosaminyldiphosphoundecaprenol N-acetyl-beta-D-mannosaminyltransferase
MGCRKILIGTTNIDSVSFIEVVDEICSKCKNKITTYVVTPNVDHIIQLQKDSEFRKAYDAASLVLSDSMPLMWAAKFLGTPLKEKISGSDLFPKLCEVASEKGYKLFFLGGRQGAALKASEVLRKKYPSIQIAGVYAPPFGFEGDETENNKIIKMIKVADPDILFVGLGAPKQEKWIYKHYKELNVPVSIGIGVTFEFVSGMVKRAPLWMQKAGLEWFWRLMMEPKRLWKRYLIDDMKFFWLVLRQKFGKGTQ